MTKTAHEQQTDYNYRATALGYAVAVEKAADSAEQVIESAKKFEAYLRGDEN